MVIFQQEPRDEEARPSDAGRNCWGLFQRPRVVKNRTKFFVGLPNSVVCWLVVSGLTEYYCLSDNHFLFGNWFSPGRRLFVQRARHAAWQADAFVRQMALFVRRPDIFHSEITRPKINSIRIFVASPLQFWSAGWNEIVNYSTAVVKNEEKERDNFTKNKYNKMADDVFFRNKNKCRLVWISGPSKYRNVSIRWMKSVRKFCFVCFDFSKIYFIFIFK